jgi:hypothetical protein
MKHPLRVLVFLACALPLMSATGTANQPGGMTPGGPGGGPPGRGWFGNPRIGPGYGGPFGTPGIGPGYGGPGYGAPPPSYGAPSPGYYGPGPSYPAPAPANPNNYPPNYGSGTPTAADPFGDPTTPWTDPGQILTLLAPPSGGPGPPFIDQPTPGSPLARNPQLLQATLDSYNANLAANWASDGYNLANGADWVGWTAQTGLTYVPGIGTTVNVPLTFARGAAEGFGAGLADPNASLAQAVERGVLRGSSASVASALFFRAVPGGGGITDITNTVVQDTVGTGSKVFVAATGVAANTLSNYVQGPATDGMDAAAQQALMANGKKGAH